MKASSRLGLRLTAAFGILTAALAVVCLVALVRLVDVSATTHAVVSKDVDLLRDTTAFDALLYQKGFVANYMLSADPLWLERLDDSRADFAAWVSRWQKRLAPSERTLLAEIVLETNAFDTSRRRAIELFDAGQRAEAVAMLPVYHGHINRLLELSQRFSNLARVETERALNAAEHSIRRLTFLLAGASLLGALLSVALGFLWARRIARPLYQLQVQIESAAERTQVHLASSPTDASELSDSIAALVQKVEDANLALAEQRRRLLQSQKMSAIGEISAKLGHEILNPLAGIKAATQLLGLQAEARELKSEDLSDSAQAIGREVTRIEQLIRRLIGYARPLAPERQLCPARTYLEAAMQAVRPSVSGAPFQFELVEEDGIPAADVDPLLMTQVFVNLYRNAIEAMKDGGTIATRVTLREIRGRNFLRIEVQDEGCGLSVVEERLLFAPFSSSKAGGHGLGLATSRNIVLEHGGTIEARNRNDGHGAVFCVMIPLAR